MHRGELQGNRGRGPMAIGDPATPLWPRMLLAGLAFLVVALLAGAPLMIGAGS